MLMGYNKTQKSPKKMFMQLTIDEEIEKQRAISWQ
jgi:hypothetical protein